MGIRSVHQATFILLGIVFLYSGCKTKSKLVKTEERLTVLKAVEVDSSKLSTSLQGSRLTVDTSKRTMDQKLTTVTKRTIDISLELDSGQLIPLDSAGKISIGGLLNRSKKLRIKIDEQIKSLAENSEISTAGKSDHQQALGNTTAADFKKKEVDQSSESKSSLAEKDKTSGPAAGGFEWLNILGLIPIVLFGIWLYKNLFNR